MKLKLLLSMLYFVCICNFSFGQQSIDAIAAIIGDEVILRSEINAYSSMRLSGIGENTDKKNDKKYEKQFIQEMIDGKILIAHAKNDSTISVTEEDVDKALNNHLLMLLKQNNLTLENLEIELKKQQGISLNKFKADLRIAIKEQLLKQKVQQKYLSSIKVNRKDVEDFFNIYKDSLPQIGESVLLKKLSIKITPSDSIRQAAFDKISSIKQKLDNGENFEDLAKKFSESPDASEGGNLGFISKGSLSELTFEEKAFALQAGQISEPFETRLGFHIVNLIEKRDQKVNIRQIFVKVAAPELMIKTITDKLDFIRLTCKTSEEFTKSVKELSNDPYTKNKNGNLGWISLLEMSSTLRDAIDTLNVGSITKPIFEDNFVSVYRIENRVDKRSLTLENDYAILFEKTRDILTQKKLLNLVEQWKDEIFIDIRL